MRHFLDELLAIEGVRGALLFNQQGMVAYRDLSRGDGRDPAATAWWLSFVNTLDNLQELELTYALGRVYIRRTANGYLMLWMGDATPLAMVRLSCDILLHGMAAGAGKKRRRGFFSRRQ